MVFWRGVRLANQSYIKQNYTTTTKHNSYNKKAKYNSHTEPLFKQWNILKLEDLHEYQSSLFMYDFANNTLPHSFDNTLKYNREIQEFRLTRQADLLRVERGTSIFYSNLPLFSLSQIGTNGGAFCQVTAYQLY